MRPSLVTDVNFKIKPKEEVAFIKKDEEKSIIEEEKVKIK